jgi:hypothetical protein
MQALPQFIPPNRTRTVFGFYPYWAPGYAQLRFQDLTHLAVFSVEAAGSGQLVDLRGWPNAPLIHAAHDANVRVILVCTLFDSSQLDSLLSSPTAQQELIANLKGQVLDGGADGINIDFEGVPARHRANLVEFMKNLALELRAAIPGAHVSIDTPAVDWSNAFDYAALADICDALHSMYMVGDTHVSRSLDGGPLLDSTSRCILPQMDGGRAVIEIANPSGAVASLHLQLQTSDGSYSLVLSIPPENSWSARVSDLFPSAFAGGAMVGMEQTDPLQASFLVVESDQAVVCSSTVQRDHDSAVIPGVSLAEMQKDASFSYIVQGRGYETEIALVNPSHEALEMELRLSGEAASSSIQIQLPPASGRIYALREVFGVVGDDMVRGVLTIHVLSGPGVIGSAWVRSTDYRIMTAMSLETSNTTFLFPHIAQAQGYWTGLSITNAADAVNRTTVEALDADGQSLGQFTVDLAPGEQRVALVYQWIPSTFGMTEGRLVIRSAGPLLAAEIFGNTDLSFIAVVPGK